jgi:hypothetical protein
MTKILTCKQLVSSLIDSSVDQKNNNFGELITLTRTHKIGKPLTFQKIEYSQEDLILLKKIITAWSWIDQNGNREFRSKRINKEIQSNLIRTIKENGTLLIYAIFCPSYKTGLNAIGYTGKVGDRTKKIIKDFSRYIYEINKIGIKIKGIVYFSDLLLENYDLLIKTNYKKDLRTNFEEFKKNFKQNDPLELISVDLLSAIKVLNKKIMERGITKGKIGVPLPIFNLILKRDLLFYKEKLGWDESKVVDRIKLLSRCYCFMGKVLKKKYLNGLMYWTESSYERANMYNGLDQDHPLAIIFPKKI